MKRVLYAEDEYTNRKLIEMLLEQRGVRCDLAENGVAAFEMFKKNDYALVLLDHYMPGLSGGEVARKIRAGGSSVPLIAITSDDSQVPALEEAGFNRVFLKPMRGPEYMDTIMSYLEDAQVPASDGRAS
ncbi:MAG: response regulator [Spirochaetales bacterium]|nr:response regulator [Spirochaetales bacterium]